MNYDTLAVSSVLLRMFSGEDTTPKMMESEEWLVAIQDENQPARLELFLTLTLSNSLGLKSQQDIMALRKTQAPSVTKNYLLEFSAAFEAYVN